MFLIGLSDINIFVFDDAGKISGFKELFSFERLLEVYPV
jgi:hypothetical protein